MRDLPPVKDDRIISTWASGEDAALWIIDQKRLGILTLDFITPIVDNPRKWGEIAACNSISDVFAMGGRPIVALNIVGFPVKKLDIEVLRQVLEGGYAKVREAGAFLVGGHSVEDDEPKYGLAVYGEVSRDHPWQVIGSMPEDALILTKPVGTGVIATGIKADMIEDPMGPEEAIRWMTTLNNVPLVLPQHLLDEIHACTDVTGFGLIGHALDMLSTKELNLCLGLHNVPLLPGVIELAESGLIPAGTYNNRIQYENSVVEIETLQEERVDMLYDAQTSGGLLLSVHKDHVPAVIAALKEAGFEKTECIGYFKKGQGQIEIVHNV